jgi:glutathione S-transferase
MAMKPTITTFGWVPEFARGFVRDLRPRWALEEIGETYEVELINNAKTEEYRCRQPFGQVPVYRDEHGETFESGAMVLRIAERGGELLPHDIEARARAIQWVIAALNSVEPFVMAVVINDVFERDQPWSKMRHDKVAADLDRRLADLESGLGDGPWLDGDRFTVGDLMMVAVLHGAPPEALAAHPKLADYVRRGKDRPAFRKAMADHLATFEQTAVPAQ